MALYANPEQDPVDAVIRPLCVWRIAAVPAAAAALVLLCYGLALVPLKKPSCLTGFAVEEVKYMSELPTRRKTWTQWTAALSFLAALGLVLGIISLLVGRTSPGDILTVVPWATAVLVIGLARPRATPILLLALFCTMLACDVTVLVASEVRLRGARTWLSISETSLTAALIVTILIMPMRDPDLGPSDVSPPFKPPTHHLRSPEDNLSLWQFLTVAWMAPLITKGRRQRLNVEDVWQLPFEFQHDRLHHLFRDTQGSVLVRLIRCNSLDIIITVALGAVELLTNVVPVFLQQLLRSIERHPGSKRPAIIYAALILLVRLVVAQSEVLLLWFARRCYERSRGEMVTMVFEKALSRKAFGAEEDADGLEESCSEVETLREEADETGLDRKGSSLWRAVKLLQPSRLKQWLSRPSKNKQLQNRASMGKILNLVRHDVYEVAQRFWELHEIVTIPLRLIVVVVLVWRLLGWPCLIGVCTVILAQLINVLIVRRLLVVERIRRSATDKRLEVTSQFIEALRHLRWYDWQQAWMDRILDARHHELWRSVTTGLWNIGMSSVNTMGAGFFPVVAFAAYTQLAGQPLRVDIAFPALQLFSTLEQCFRDLPHLIKDFLNASVALSRIESFMKEPNKEESGFEEASATSNITFDRASFAWPGTGKNVLTEIDLCFGSGLSLVTGRVGQGKSALLQAGLGELDRTEGGLLRPDIMIGYCAQSPWLQSMSIRDNILFSTPLDSSRYRQTLDACALMPDLARFKHGDLSNIGENGIGLSGGQKARVALARAVYSQAKVLFLDDPLAALDHDTASIIAARLFDGPLMQGRTVVLVTHRVDICLPLATQVVEIDDGRARILNKTVASSLSDESSLPQESRREQAPETQPREDDELADPDSFLEDEHRAEGAVVASVYWQFIKSGDLRWWLALLLGVVVFRLFRLGNYWFLKSWGEAYGEPQTSSTSSLFGWLPSPDVNLRPWLAIYAAIAMALAFADSLTDIMLMIIIYLSGKHLFKDALHRVSGATFRFYETTPVGRLMNRMTSDFGTLDEDISWQLMVMMWCSVSWASGVIIIASTTPLFLLLTLVLTVVFIWIFRWFLPTSQSLRRLETVSLSPLLSNFGTLLEGLVTVRSFCAQTQFQATVIKVTDTFQKMDHFYWSLQAWLMWRFDSLAAASTFILTLVALYDNLSPGLTAFILTTAANFVANTHFLCKGYGQLQMDFVSVERVVELLHLEQEPSGTVDPPATWPSRTDDVVFENVTIRYAPHLEPALSQVSFRIPGASTTAIIGRTGSGKSTLALALLATMHPEAGGHICIGDVDLATVDVHALRQRVTFVAQDPVLFPGTLRQNLDPTDAWSEQECADVLQRVLATAAAATASLSTPAEDVAGPGALTLATTIETGGRNLSQGQRQLVGLGRAILRRSPVVILDEATASIDHETALVVQRVLREELRESTVVVIAHRVEAVRDAQWALMLEAGRVATHGRAVDIMERQLRAEGDG